jgi:3'-phosphoadenosine 5'-phosphosulfate sulfotransferase (PAPS reductase)/FAD synthetase
MSDRFDVGLISGGQDSLAAVHVAAEKADLDILAYLDTGTGATANREYVESVADCMGLQLWTLRTHESYAEKVTDHGFPGPSRHHIMYSLLKERQLGKLATAVSGDLHLWTGVRRHESQRRMGHVESVVEADRWTWHAPIHDWRKSTVLAYIADLDAPENPLWDTLGRSADCWCGCFGSPEELIDAEACGLDDVVAQMDSLEDQLDRDDERGRWAWGGMTDAQARAERAKDRDMTLCSSCMPARNETGDGDG